MLVHQVIFIKSDVTIVCIWSIDGHYRQKEDVWLYIYHFDYGRPGSFNRRWEIKLCNLGSTSEMPNEFCPGKILNFGLVMICGGKKKVTACETWFSQNRLSYCLLFMLSTLHEQVLLWKGKYRDKWSETHLMLKCALLLEQPSLLCNRARILWLIPGPC